MERDAQHATHRGDAGSTRYASTGNPADPNEHRHGSVVHSHAHTGPHEHGDDYEYDEAHDPETRPPDAP
jgi:hypothetical protein